MFNGIRLMLSHFGHCLFFCIRRLRLTTNENASIIIKKTKPQIVMIPKIKDNKVKTQKSFSAKYKSEVLPFGFPK